MGIRYDKQLIFVPQAEVACKMKARAIVPVQIIRTDWGFDLRTLRSTYVATGSTKAKYTPDWNPWMSERSLGKLEIAERSAGGRFSGHVKTTPNDAILVVRNLPPVKTRSRQIVIAHETSLLLSGSNLRYAVTTTVQKQKDKEKGIQNLLQ